MKTTEEYRGNLRAVCQKASLVGGQGVLVYAPHILDLLDDLAELQRERDALRGVVEKLPLTKDGVRVTNGTKVYPSHPISETDHGVIHIGLWDDEMDCWIEDFDISTCYSAREAAEAALAKGKPVTSPTPTA